MYYAYSFFVTSNNAITTYEYFLQYLNTNTL